jgi:hypothetical protein
MPTFSQCIFAHPWMCMYICICVDVLCILVVQVDLSLMTLAVYSVTPLALFCRRSHTHAYHLVLYIMLSYIGCQVITHTSFRQQYSHSPTHTRTHTFKPLPNQYTLTMTNKIDKPVKLRSGDTWWALTWKQPQTRSVYLNTTRHRMTLANQETPNVWKYHILTASFGPTVHQSVYRHVEL